MSDENYTVTIGDSKFDITSRTLKAKRINKDTKKREDYDHPIITPTYTDVESASRLFGALLVEAEKREAGNGLRLADAILLDRIQEASDSTLNLETGETDIAKYITLLSAHARPRSHGQSKEDINKEMYQFTAEMLELKSASRTADGWTKVRNADGSARFASMEECVLRYDFVSRRVEQLIAAIQAIETKNAAAAAKRKETADKAAAAAKAAAGAAAPTH